MVTTKSFYTYIRNKPSLDESSDEEFPSLSFEMSKYRRKGEVPKTVIANIDDVSFALRRSVQEILRFLRLYCGNKIEHDEKTGVVTISGGFSEHTIQYHLNYYVDTFVLCRKCEKLNTRYEAVCSSNPTKKPKLLRTCKSCGSCTVIHGTNSINKMSQWIVGQLIKAKEFNAAVEKTKLSKSLAAKRAQKHRLGKA